MCRNKLFGWKRAWCYKSEQDEIGRVVSMDYPRIFARSPQNSFLEGLGLAESRNKNNGVERQPGHGVTGAVFRLVISKQNGVKKMEKTELMKKAIENLKNRGEAITTMAIELETKSIQESSKAELLPTESRFLVGEYGGKESNRIVIEFYNHRYQSWDVFPAFRQEPGRYVTSSGKSGTFREKPLTEEERSEYVKSASDMAAKRQAAKAAITWRDCKEARALVSMLSEQGVNTAVIKSLLEKQFPLRKRAERESGEAAYAAIL